jgi:hypothetical protein
MFAGATLRLCRTGSVALLTVGLAIAPATVRGQSTEAARELRLPGGVVDPPDWLVKDAPFDMIEFFARPRPEENAAPLYLDAILEFGPGVAACFPTDVRARADAARERNKRLMTVWEPWAKDTSSVDVERIDETISDHAEGLRKLDVAQARPRCVFATGITIESPLPHAQDARAITRVLALQAARALDRDEFDSAIASVEKSLRLSRDLRPRGMMVVQLVSFAMDGTVALYVMPYFLAHPRLRPEHCDRMIAAIDRHEAAAIDAYTTGIKGEYVIVREVVRRFEDHVRLRVGPDGRPIDEPLGPGRAFRELMDGVGGEEDQTAQDIALGLTATVVYGVGSPKNRAAFTEIARTLLAAAPESAPGRRRAWEAVEAKYTDQASPDAMVLSRLLIPAYNAFIEAEARDHFYLGSSKALLALRRWELSHGAPAPSLEAACREAKMPGVPVDFFSGGPLKLATIDGSPVVYSVGADGRDDGALKDSHLGRKPEGDMLARMPRVRAR